MSDEDLRRAERAFEASPSLSAETELLRERQRSGLVSRACLGLAAYLGHEAAVSLVAPWSRPPREPDPDEEPLAGPEPEDPLAWLEALPDLGLPAFARVLTLALELTRDQWCGLAAVASLAEWLGEAIQRARYEHDWEPDVDPRPWLELGPPWGIESWSQAWEGGADPVSFPVLAHVFEEFARVGEEQVAALDSQGIADPEVAAQSPGASAARLGQASLTAFRVISNVVQALEGGPETPNERLLAEIFGLAAETPEDLKRQRFKAAVSTTSEFLQQVARSLDGQAPAQGAVLDAVQRGLASWLCGHAPSQGAALPFLDPGAIHVPPPLAPDQPVELVGSLPWNVWAGDSSRVEDPQVLAEFDGCRPDSEPYSTYAGAELTNILYGGELVFHHSSEGLRGELRFVAPRPLKVREVHDLETWVSGQLTDGFGESMFLPLPSDPSREFNFSSGGSRMRFEQKTDPAIDLGSFVRPEGAALLEAAFEGDLERVQELLTAGVSPRTKNRHGVTAISRAVHGGRLEVFRLLLARVPGTDLEQELLAASAEKNLDFLELLLEHGVDPNATVPAGEFIASRSALVETLRMNNEAAFELLLGAGADVNHRLHDERTILFWTLEPERIERLLALGANPAVSDCAGLSPSDLALEQLSYAREQLETPPAYGLPRPRAEREETVSRFERALALLTPAD